MATDSTSARRIAELEQQVKSLTETVNAMYDMLYCDRRGVPRVRTAMMSLDGEHPGQAVDQATESLSLETLRRFLKPTAPNEPIADWESLKPYEYTALNSNLSEIRVIGLQTAKSIDDCIQCNLYNIALDDVGAPSPNFSKGVLKYPLATLSYTWGDAADREPIVVDGKSLSITRNLYTALKHFRDSPEYSILADKWRLFWWIDAICINQQDLDERKSQVQLMTRLYRSASVGHIWLGPEADESTRAMKVIRRLGYSPRTTAELTAWEYKQKKGERYQQMGPGLPPRKLDEEPAPISVDDRAANYEAVIKLLSRPWFSRVWIRQEFSLPNNISFHCGRDVCTWQELTKAGMMFSLMVDAWKVPELQRDDIKTTAPLVSCFRRVEELRQLRERLISLRKGMRQGAKTFLTMRHVLYHARDSDATDPRDKVYSMLPLTNPDETQLVADYRKPHFDVYKAAALDMARTTLNFLCACQYMPENRDLPSWVPDLSSKWRYRPTIGYLEADGPNPDAIDYQTKSPECRYLPNDNSLEAQGTISDAIFALCEVISTDSPSLAELESLLNAWSDFYQAERTIERSPANRDPARLSWERLDPDLQIYSGASNTRFSFHKGNHDLYTIATADNQFVADPIDYNSSEVRVARNFLPEFELPDISDESWQVRFNRRKRSQAPHFVVGRRFAMTKDKAFGLVPLDAEIGDQVCHFTGSAATFIIRKKSDKTGYSLIGDARKSSKF